MTVEEIIRGVRVLMHDTGDGYSTANMMYDDDDMRRALLAANTELSRSLILRQPIPYVTCCRLIKTTDAEDGDPVPEDLLYLNCGFKSDGTYVPYVTLPVGNMWRDSGDDQVWIEGGILRGTMDSIQYWSKPSDTFASGAMTQFNDAYYNTLKYGAAMQLLMKEPSGASLRFGALLGEYNRKLSTLQ